MSSWFMETEDGDDEDAFRDTFHEGISEVTQNVDGSGDGVHADEVAGAGGDEGAAGGDEGATGGDEGAKKWYSDKEDEG